MVKASKRIGIYSGSFDPIHLGHITFALQAFKLADLDELYFLPERQPINKNVQELFGHRVAMAKRAIKPYKKFKLLELDEKHFSVAKTLPKLQSRFKNDQLVFLFGSDIVASLAKWPDSAKLLESSELVIGVRDGDTQEKLLKLTNKWQAMGVFYIDSYAPKVASTKIRLALNHSKKADGLLSSVSKYIRKNWLYISFHQ
jgi:nicotinate-nucleotide adenylyltransferase